MRLSDLLPPALGCLLLWSPATALASTPAPSPKEAQETPRPPAASAVQPPTVLGTIPPSYPTTPNQPGARVRVVLTVTVASDGSVEDAQIETGAAATGADEAFDASALAVARATTFSPAVRDGVPVPARVLFAVDFEPPAEQPPDERHAEEQPQQALPQDEDLPLAGGVSAQPAKAPPDPPPSASTRPPPASPEAELEVVVQDVSAAHKLRSSAYVVEVVELADAQKKSADLGQVLARQTSLSVQREGGLGSAGRYSLAGLSGDRVRFFIDGIPLELLGLPSGVGNVPVGLIERVEVYQGLVPARFGADALGGAVHLVTDAESRRDRWALSYQLGSFNTHRLALSGKKHLENGLVIKGSAFFDSAENNYPVNVEVFDDSGQLEPARVPRFHDGYVGAGTLLSVGVVDRPWADRLMLTGFASDFDRDVQHNTNMSVPYGEVTYGKATGGTNLVFARRYSRLLGLDVTGGYTYRRSTFQDLSRCRYDWYGRCFIELPLAGEIESIPTDRGLTDHTGFARAQLALFPAAGHMLRLAFAPTFVSRSGRDRAIPSDAYDPLTAVRQMLTGVMGLEVEARPLPALSNILSLKAYGQLATSDELRPTGQLEHLRSETLTFGVGDGVRFTFAPSVYLKASYEYATRLPTADERFGDGGLVVGNLELDPERSHNANLALVLDELPSKLGVWSGGLLTSGRWVDDLVLLFSTGSYLQYDNVLRARVLALNVNGTWVAPGDFLGLEARLDAQDVRNVSTEGPGALFHGDQVPNLPDLKASTSAWIRRRNVLSRGDHVELAWSLTHVGAFLLGWESAGAEQAEKLTIPSQSVQSLSLSHVAPGEHASLSTSLEVQNLTDELAYDFYGVQRPGRSFSIKIALNHP